MRAPIAGDIARLIRANNSLGAGVPDGPSTSLRHGTCCAPSDSPPPSAGSDLRRSSSAWRTTAPSPTREARPAKGPPYWRACSCVGAVGGGRWPPTGARLILCAIRACGPRLIRVRLGASASPERSWSAWSPRRSCRCSSPRRSS